VTQESGFRARYWHLNTDGRIQCELCPRDCQLHDGQRGACFVRMRQGDQLILATYGRSSGFCIDPIEKKPLHHFFPGSSVLSFGTAGCNLSCKFCQNHDISKSRDMDRLMDSASPNAIALAAQHHGCKSVAFTYNDPVIFAEYAMDVADACHEQDIQTVAVTAGYIHADARREFFSRMDAANVDLKAFSEDFYARLTGSHLQPVLDTLVYLCNETRVWVEITTLLIPGHNDSDQEVTAMCRWIKQQLGPDVPMHFSAFHPDHKMPHVPATPTATLVHARQLAMEQGLNFVYTGNVHNSEGDTTNCPRCHTPMIVRDWYQIDQYRLTTHGSCSQCGTDIAGRFGATNANFGRHRIPIRLK